MGAAGRLVIGGRRELLPVCASPGVDRRSISCGNPEERPVVLPTPRTVEVGDSQDENMDSDQQVWNSGALRWEALSV